MVRSGGYFLYLLILQSKCNSLNAIIGTYECKADVKGRLLLPAPLKKQLTASLQDGFVLKRSVFDKCEEAQHTEQSSNKESKKDCNECSPFCACSSAHGSTNNKINPFLEVVAFNIMPVYSSYALSSTSGYHSGFFQPPRLG